MLSFDFQTVVPKESSLAWELGELSARVQNSAPGDSKCGFQSKTLSQNQMSKDVPTCQTKSEMWSYSGLPLWPSAPAMVDGTLILPSKQMLNKYLKGMQNL